MDYKEMNTKEILKFNVCIFALEKDNHFPNGKVNWNYVDADMFIQFGKKYDHDLIAAAVDETAKEYENTLNQQ